MARLHVPVVQDFAASPSELVVFMSAACAFDAFFLAQHQHNRVADLKAVRENLFRLIGDREQSWSWKLTCPLRLADRGRRGAARLCGQNRVQPPTFQWMDSLTLSKRGVELATDISRLIMNDRGTGIQRVVRNVAKEFVALKTSSVVGLDFRHGDLQEVPLLFGKSSTTHPRTLRSFRRLLMLDASWDLYRELPRLWSACTDASIPVINCVHDLIPIDFPGQTSGDLPAVFRSWLNLCAAYGDAFICVSESTARRLERFLTLEYRGRLRAKKIGWWSLGSDLETAANQEASDDFLIPPGPYVLCVGTFEPRKNQDFLLEAFSRRWREENYPASLVFAGRDGWKTEDLIRRIEEHPEFGRRLWWFRGVEDDYLQELYRRCAAVVMASSAEGFGLPIVEGARFHKPIVLTDIPVFREIVEKNGYFFAVNDAGSLRQALDRALASDALATNVREVTWRESAQELYDLIVEEKYQITL